MVTLTNSQGAYDYMKKMMLNDIREYGINSSGKYFTNETTANGALSTLCRRVDTLVSAVVESLVREKWTNDCERALEMYLGIRSEYLYLFGRKYIDHVIDSALSFIMENATGHLNIYILNDIVLHHISRLFAERSLMDEILSEDNIKKGLNYLLLSDDDKTRYFAMNAGDLLDQYIFKLSGVDPAEDNPESEQEDPNVIDGTYKDVSSSKPTSLSFNVNDILGMDFPSMLAKYDITAINTSIIQYYQAIQQWTDELMDKLEGYEQKLSPLIRDFNQISLKLSKKYKDSPHLTDEENALLSGRQLYFQKKFSLGLNNAKSKILAVRKQADELEARIDEIDNSEGSIHELALLEKEERVSFSFLAENTAKIIKNAFQKIQYFQDNRRFIASVVEIWETWTEDYRAFKTASREELKASCEKDGIEEELWGRWFEDWQKIRLSIEQKVQPMVERGLKSPIPTATEAAVSIPEQAIGILAEYKHAVDRFFLEERKGIYQKFAFQPGGELQDKFETESELYKCTVSLQNALQEVIFNCENAEDRVFILKWADSLLDIQIDEILDFTANKDLQQLSGTLLSEFAALKQKNFDVYLTDAEAYSKERARREKEYNSLVFKMRKDLME